MPANRDAPQKFDIIIAAGIFLLTFVVYWFSPIKQVTDSNYSMLLSEDLLEHRSFVLDHYAIPRLTPEYHYNTIMNGAIHQIEVRDNHFYYYFPPGSSVLSVPFVAVFKLFGMSAHNADQTPNVEGEIRIQALLAALLMAALSVIIFRTALLVLPIPLSLVIALGSSFGTQMWSTASRAMWTETWSILLMGVVVWMLLRSQLSARAINPYLLATILAWTYFVRPTNAIAVVAITAWIYFYQRKILFRYILTGAAWFAGFVAYSWYHFHQLLPQYYLANRLAFKEAGTALLGNLVSPSRGLFVFVPVLLFVAFLLVSRRRQLSLPSLVWLSLAIVALHLIVIAGFDPWHGGSSYGPRFTTGLIPWFVLLSIVALKAMLSADRNGLPFKLTAICGALLLITSIAINARGALSRETWVWNVRPINIDDAPERVWGWRQPQFLAGLVRPPRPTKVALVSNEPVKFGDQSAEKYLWFGWSGPDTQSRWTDAKEAAIVFRLTDLASGNAHSLAIQLAGFVPHEHPQQRVNVLFNGVLIESFLVVEASPISKTITLPPTLLREDNDLTFELPDAMSPAALGLSNDTRPLAIAVYSLELK